MCDVFFLYRDEGELTLELGGAETTSQDGAETTSQDGAEQSR